MYETEHNSSTMVRDTNIPLRFVNSVRQPVSRKWLPEETPATAIFFGVFVPLNMYGCLFCPFFPVLFSFVSFFAFSFFFFLF